MKAKELAEMLLKNPELEVNVVHEGEFCPVEGIQFHKLGLFKDRYGSVEWLDLQYKDNEHYEYLNEEKTLNNG